MLEAPGAKTPTRFTQQSDDFGGLIEQFASKTTQGFFTGHTGHAVHTTHQTSKLKIARSITPTGPITTAIPAQKLPQIFDSPDPVPSSPFYHPSLQQHHSSPMSLQANPSMHVDIGGKGYGVKGASRGGGLRLNTQK